MEEEARMVDARNIIAVMSGKGGVGKSTITSTLALMLSERGNRVGVLDADLHGPDIPKMLGVEGVPPMATEDGKMVPIEVTRDLSTISMGFLLQTDDTPVIWRGPLKMGAIRQFLFDVEWGRLDYLLIDLPPGTGDEALSVAQLLPQGCGSIIVTTPQDVALLDSRKAVNFGRKLELKVLGIVENMAGLKCPHCGGMISLFGSGGGEKAALEMDVPFLGRVPLDPVMVSHGDTGYSEVPRDNISWVAIEGICSKLENAGS